MAIDIYFYPLGDIFLTILRTDWLEVEIVWSILTLFFNIYVSEWPVEILFLFFEYIDYLPSSSLCFRNDSILLYFSFRLSSPRLIIYSLKHCLFDDCTLSSSFNEPFLVFLMGKQDSSWLKKESSSISC